MSDNPQPESGSADLGSVHYTLESRYDRRQFEQFLRDAEQFKRLSQQLSRSANPAAANRQAQAQTRSIAQAEIRANATVEAARIRSQATIEAAEKARIARVNTAEITAATRIEQTRLRVAAQERRSASGSGAVLPRSFAGLTRQGVASAASFAASYVAADALLGKMVEIGEESLALANRAEGVGEAFQEEAAKAGIAAEDLTARLREATRGTVSDLELQQNAVRALMGGLTDNADEMAQIFEIARIRARKLGFDTTDAVNRIVQGLAKRETELLDELGLTLDANAAYERYADSIDRTVDSLSQQEKTQALVQNLIANNINLLNEQGDAALSNAEKQEQAAARFENAQVRIGRALQDPVADNLDAGATLVERMIDLFDRMGRSARVSTQAFQDTSTFEEYVAALDKINTERKGFFNQGQQLTREQYNFAQALIATGTATEEAIRQALEYDDVLSLISGDQIETGDTLRAMQRQLLDLATSSPRARDEIIELIRAYQDTGDLDAFQRGVWLLAQSQEEQGDKAAYAATQTERHASAMAGAVGPSEDLKRAQDELRDTIIRTGAELARAERDRTDALADAYDDYQDKVADLNERIAESQVDEQQAINEAVADGAADRIKIERDAANQIGDITRDYAERREDLLRSQAEEEARIQEERRRADLAAERDYQESLLGIRSSFTQRIFDLFRGRRGAAGQREQALAALRQAEQEAAEIAKMDAQAVAEYLQARQRQILEALERQRETAQQQRDSQRGLPGYSRSEANAERDQEQAAIDAANRAELDGIRQRAEERQRARSEEDAQRADANQEALDDLNEQERQALAAVEEATTEQLAALEERQQERLAQIRRQGGEQRAELARQLEREKALYDEKQQDIQDDYDRFVRELRQSLIDAANNLQYTPDEQKQREVDEAFRAIGGRWGDALADALQAALDATVIRGPVVSQPQYGQVPENVGNGTRPTSGGSGGTTARTPAARGGSVALGDPTLSGRAIDQVVLNGVQSDSYSALRNGDLHRGVDIAAPEGKAINSPVDGTILKSDATAAWGNYTIVKTASGDLWYFGHMQKPGLKAGTQVRRGQRIGTVGSTGAVTGPHVHVQLTRGGRVVDPTAALEQLATPRQPSGRVGGTEAGAQTLRSNSASQNVSGSVGTYDSVALPVAPQTVPPLPTAYSAAGVGGVNLTVDMRGSSYGAGVDPRQIEEAARRGAQTVLSEYEAAEARRIEQRRVGGGRRTL